MKDFGIEQLNKFNVSVAESLKIIEGIEGKSVDLAKGNLLDALRRMSEYFVDSNKPIDNDKKND